MERLYQPGGARKGGETKKILVGGWVRLQRLSKAARPSLSDFQLLRSMAVSAANTTAALSAFPTPYGEVKMISVSTGRRCVRFGGGMRRSRAAVAAAAMEKGKGVNNSNYVVPLDKASSGITRPLAEILRDLNKRVPDNIINNNTIPWYHVNRMLSFYAPGWCGEVRDIIYSENGTVTVIYRVTIRGSDGEAHRESTATESLIDRTSEDDPVAAAEEMAFCRACARFGFGLYLYHEDEILQE